MKLDEFQYHAVNLNPVKEGIDNISSKELGLKLTTIACQARRMGKTLDEVAREGLDALVEENT